MKNAYQGNFIQSGLDSQLSSQLGQFNAGLAQSNMTHQADLEQRRQVRNDEGRVQLWNAEHGRSVPI